jgi:hypothetical protein
VTWRSCITSSSADWTFAGARLISSASRKLQNPAGVRPIDPGADEICRDEVGRELQALERAAEHVRHGLDGERLGQAGDALEQDVTAREQRHQHALEHRLLADDHALDLEQAGLERVVGDAGGTRVLVLALQCPQAPLVRCHPIS